MVAAVGPGLDDVAGSLRIVVGERDQVERPETLRAAFADVFPQAVSETVPVAGHQLPVERPGAIASACRGIAAAIGTSRRAK